MQRSVRHQGDSSVSQELLAIAQQPFREAAELEDSGAHGGMTWARYVTALQQYGEVILRERDGLALVVCERLESALASAEAALKPPRRPGLDLAIARLRGAVEEASAVAATAAG
jgi:hypothetical protein